jgi:methyl-accepting chemotaxis protein
VKNDKTFIELCNKIINKMGWSIMAKKLSKQHRFNVMVIWVLSILATTSAFVGNGVTVGIRGLVITFTASIIATFVAFLYIPELIKCIAIPLAPGIACLIFSALSGGLIRVFPIYIVTVCLSAIYFRRDVVLYYGSIFSAILLAGFIVSPQSIVGSLPGAAKEFPSLFAALIGSIIVLTVLTKWGRELIEEALEKGKFAEEISMKLKDNILHIDSIANTLSSSVNNCYIAIKESNEGANSVVQAVRGTASAAEEEANSVLNINEAMADSKNKVTEAYKLSEDIEINFKDTSIKVQKGYSDVVNMSNQMNVIGEAITSAEENVWDLNNKMKDIFSFLSGITQIADQTNLLALNASIEAARAGEHGRGFAVVAEEVRKLAEESNQTAGEIKEIISSVQNSSNLALEKVQKGAMAVKEGNQKVNNVSIVFDSVKESIEFVNKKLTNEYEMMNETITQFEKVQSQLENLASVSEENSATTEEILATMEFQSNSIKEIKSMIEAINDMGNQLKSMLKES